MNGVEGRNGKEMSLTWEDRETGTCHIYAVWVHAVFGGVDQRLENSCGHINNVLARTWGEDDGEVCYHAAGGKSSDFHSHLP